MAATLALTSSFARADGPPAPAPDAAAPAPTAPAVPPTATSPASTTLPGPGFSASRYEVLWTKSPFAVATSETVGEESPDYSLVGIATVDGTSYGSVIEHQHQEHFLITTGTPNRGLTLKSITVGHDGQDTVAQVMKDGQLLTLKLEQAPAAVGVNGMPPMGMNMAPQIPMPSSPSFPNNGSVRPFARFHHPTIHLPPINPTPPPTPPPATAQ